MRFIIFMIIAICLLFAISTPSLSPPAAVSIQSENIICENIMINSDAILMSNVTTSESIYIMNTANIVVTYERKVTANRQYCKTDKNFGQKIRAV